MSLITDHYCRVVVACSVQVDEMKRTTGAYFKCALFHAPGPSEGNWKSLYSRAAAVI